MAKTLKTGLAQYKDVGKITNSSTSNAIKALTGRMLSAKIVGINQVKGNKNGIAVVEILEEILSLI